MIELDLKRRFLLATLSLAIVFVGGYTLAIAEFIEVIEFEFAEREFQAYLDEFVRARAAAPAALPALPAGVTAYVAENGELSSVPEALRKVQSGIHLEVALADSTYTVARRDVGTTRLILIADSNLDPVEHLEHELLRIAFLVGIAALMTAAAMAWWLARVVLGPVQALARCVSAVDPDRPRLPLVAAGVDKEIAQIAHAFERTLVRYDDMVERERAFTRDASHELRTPIAVMLTGIELLEGQAGLSTQDRTRLDRIRSAAEQMRALTEGLLFLARQSGTFGDERTNVAEVVQDAIRIQRLAQPLRGDELRLEMGEPCHLTVPRGLLLCVVNNLLRNALEHAGGRGVEVRLARQSLSVADRGAGITPALAAHIFERHVRGAHSAGEGLGLFIVKRICDRLGWCITVETATDTGTRFTLSFEQASPTGLSQ